MRHRKFFFHTLETIVYPCSKKKSYTLRPGIVILSLEDPFFSLPQKKSDPFFRKIVQAQTVINTHKYIFIFMNAYVYAMSLWTFLRKWFWSNEYLRFNELCLIWLKYLMIMNSVPLFIGALYYFILHQVMGPAITCQCLIVHTTNSIIYTCPKIFMAR